MDEPTPSANSSSKQIGYANHINDYLISIDGLPDVAINELVETQNKARGLVTNLDENLVEVMMLDRAEIHPKEMFLRTNQIFSIKVGEFFLGRVINPLGQPVDGKTRFPVNQGKDMALIQPIPPIKHRERIKEQFETGVTIVDMLVPLAKGQRELVVGNARSGKTSFLTDTIVNQRGKGIICIYATIGKPIREIKQLTDTLSVNHALDYTIVVAAPSSELASVIFLAPLTALTIAEYFQKQGKDVLLILDDLGVHAKFYREISLLGNRPPGRESYPGDIFYQHAYLMERAGKFNKSNGGGSITLLPAIEINLDDYTAFIPTNLMAMTDGHLMFDSKLAHQGIRPALDITLSVSRVGRQAQMLSQKLLADRVRTLLAEAQKVETLSRFGSEVSAETQRIIEQSKQIKAILEQPNLVYIPTLDQMILLGLTFTPLFVGKGADFVALNKDRILKFLSTLDRNALHSQIQQFANDNQFLSSLNNLVPKLEEICQSSK